MRKLTQLGFIALAMLVLPAVAHATCSGSGTTWSCTAGSTASQIQTAINSASDGFTMTFAAGSYTITSEITFSNTVGGTLICATTPATHGGSTSAPCTINYSNNVVFGSFVFAGANTKFYRISGFTFDGGGSSPGTGVIWFDNSSGCGGSGACPTSMYGPAGVGGFRFDHNTFQNQGAGSVGIFFGHNNPSGATIPVGHYAGVIDHNYANTAQALIFVQYIGYPDPSPPANQMGTFNNVFLEDNIIYAAGMANESAAACTDGWGGAAYVVRYNTSNDCVWAAHGATHAGGPANYEFYNNTTTLDSGATGQSPIDCYRCWHHQGSGTNILFNNVFNAPGGYDSEIISMANYRGFANGPSIDAGIAACDGTVTSLSYDGLTIADGNRSPEGSNYGYPCWHQPGRDFAGNYAPMYTWNNTTGAGAQINMVIPDFGGTVPNGSVPPSNCTTSSSGNCDYNSFQVKANRDYYNAVSSSAQTSPTSPFNGTTGIGCNLGLAEQPAPRIPQSQVLALDTLRRMSGSQGTLYTCSATNVWSVHYTPYTYPHPLVGGGGGGGQVWSNILKPTSGTGACSPATISSPQSCGIDWTQVGVVGGIPSGSWTQSGSTIAAGASASTVQTALNGCGTNHYVLLGPGAFTFSSDVQVPSHCVLRGSGTQSTVITYTGTTGFPLYAGSKSGDSGDVPNMANAVSISSGATAGSTSLVVSSASNFQVGGLFVVTELNDPNSVSATTLNGFCNYCDAYLFHNAGTRVRGQTVKITGVSGTTITFTPALYTSYTNTPLASPYGVSTGSLPDATMAGIENLQLYATNSAPNSSVNGSMISLWHCDECWVKGVEDNWADSNHVSIGYCYRCEVDDSYFTNAFVHQSGGSDVELQVAAWSSGVLIQNNILERLHSSIVLEWGVAGNVIGYNYTLATFDSGATNVTNEDIAFHGASPQFNLLEGNVTDDLNYDAFWGSTTNNTNYRNLVRGAATVCPFTDATYTASSAHKAVNWSGCHISNQQNRSLTLTYENTNVNSIGNIYGSQDASTAAGGVFYNSASSPFTSTMAPSTNRLYNGQFVADNCGYNTGSDADGSAVASFSGGPGPTTGYWVGKACGSQFQHGNFDIASNSIIWNGSITHTLPASLYLSSKPSWWGSLPYPAIGPDITGGSIDSTILAGHAYGNPAYAYYNSIGRDSLGVKLFDPSAYYSSSSPSPTWTGVLSASRAVNWSNAGATIPSNRTQCGSTVSAGASTSTIQTDLYNCGSGTYLLLGPGTFNITGLEIPSNVTLRGSGANSTFLVFSSGYDCEGWQANICVDGSDTNYWEGPTNSATWSGASTTSSVTSGTYTQGATYLTLSNTSNLAIGNPLILDQVDNQSDPGSGSLYVGCEIGSSSGGDSSTACYSGAGTGGYSRGEGALSTVRGQQQVVKVTSISGSTVGITPGLYANNWRTSQTPQAWWASGPVQNVGVENLSMDSSADSSTYSGLLFLNCQNCWEKGVRSITNGGSLATGWFHTAMWICDHCTVRDSYFFGNTGDDYVIHTATDSDILVENNIMQFPSPTQWINGDCEGCVWGYNFGASSLYHTGTGGDAGWLQSNIDHAVQLYSLFEGNISANVYADSFHGSKNLMTYFRNRLDGHEQNNGNATTGNTIPIRINPASRYFNVVGNILGTPGYHNTYQSNGGTGFYTSIYGCGAYPEIPMTQDALSCPTTMFWGNYDTKNAATQWNSSEVPSSIGNYANPVPSSHTLPASFYYASQPSWWPSGKAWPAIGPDVIGGNVGQCSGGTNDSNEVVSAQSSQCSGGSFAAMATVVSNPAMDCYFNVMGGTAKGTGSPLSFNPTACYSATPAVATPTFSPAAGTYTSTQTVTVSTATSGATLCYTTDGTTPTANGAGACTHGTTYTSPVSVSSSSVLRAVGSESGYTDSSMGSASYIINGPAATPTFSPAAGSYSSAQSVTISSSTSGSTIYYTTDGSTPTSLSPVYSGPVTVGVTETVKAIAVATGYSTSAVGSAAYTITFPTVATPTLSPSSGIPPQTVTLSDSTAGSAICYTVDGTTPTATTPGVCSHGTTYTSPISVTANPTTINAIGTRSGDTNSSMATGTYSGTVNFTLTVSTAGSGVAGSTVTGTNCSTGTLASGTPVSCTPNPGTGMTFTGWSGACTGTTVPCAFSMTGNTVVTATFDALVSAPTFLPAAGTYTSPQTVAMTSTTSGVTVCYTTDSSTPTGDGNGNCTHGTTYTAPVTVSSSTTLMVMGTKPGYINSHVNTAAYVITSSSQSATVVIKATEGSNGTSSTGASPGRDAYTNCMTGYVSGVKQPPGEPDGELYCTAAAQSSGEANGGPTAGYVTATISGTGTTNVSNGNGAGGTNSATSLTATYGGTSLGMCSGIGTNVSTGISGLTLPGDVANASTVYGITTNGSTYNTSLLAPTKWNYSGGDAADHIIRETCQKVNSVTTKGEHLEFDTNYHASTSDYYGWGLHYDFSTSKFYYCPQSCSGWKAMSLVRQSDGTVFTTMPWPVNHAIYTQIWMSRGAVGVCTHSSSSNCFTYDKMCFEDFTAGGGLTCYNLQDATTGLPPGGIPVSYPSWTPNQFSLQHQWDVDQGNASLIANVDFDNLIGYYLTSTPTAATPTFSPATGTYSAGQLVTISDSTSGSTIYYTTDGSTPTTSSAVYSSPVSVTSTKTLNAIATASGYSTSAVGSATYTINTPISLDSHAAFNGGSSSFSTATVHLTPSQAGEGITCEVAFNSSSTPTVSDNVNGTYLVAVPMHMNPSVGSYSGIFYVASASASAVTVTLTIGASAQSVGLACESWKPVSAGTFTLDTAFTQTLDASSSSSPTTGTAKTPSAANELVLGSLITHGQTPTSGASFALVDSMPSGPNLFPEYWAQSTASSTNAPYTLPVADAWTDQMAAFSFSTSSPTPAATPTFSPAGATYTSVQSVTISDTTSGASIYYTTDGSTPTTSSTHYTGAVTVSASETLKAIATASGFTTSSVGTASYVINLPSPAATPTFSPVAGTYTSTQTVTITDSTPSSTIYYTLDGSTPSTSSSVYSTALTVSATKTIKAIATASGSSQSAVGSALYTILTPAATPTFSPPTGTYNTAQTVTIVDTTPGAVIYYTLDGSTPTTSSSTYSGAITVSASETIKAIATASGFTQSSVGSSAYVISPTSPGTPQNLMIIVSGGGL